MSQNDNARRFLDAYASIEHELSTMARETRYIPFSQLLSMCAKHSWVVSHHQEELREFNELRNAIVHLRDSRNEIIAQPTDQAVQDIERLAKLLTGDDTLLQYASKPVKTVSLQDTIPSAYTLMKSLALPRCRSMKMGSIAVYCRWRISVPGRWMDVMLRCR